LDWKCKLFTNFSASNFGSGIWPYESINWAFNHVEKLLVIEDDVLISEDFYRESNKLLEYYKDQREVFGICASNISDMDAVEHSNAIYFSRYFSGWGWATWKNRWEEYRFDITKEPRIGFLKLLKANNGNFLIALYFLINFYLVKQNKIQAWDYQINHLLFSSNKFVIKFKKNLSSNIGTGKDSTHTKYLPKIEINKINGSYDSNIHISLMPEEEKRWRKSRTRFILESWLMRIRNFEKNTTR
jgi:GR25 family glycosyltransferase involved in LPS biosynthesis